MLTDLGQKLTLERVSPSSIVLTPPEKLVLEVKATGRYNYIKWTKNGNSAGSDDFPVTSDNIFHFGEVFVQNETTLDDLQVYGAELIPHPGQTAPKRVEIVAIQGGMSGII